MLWIICLFGDVCNLVCGLFGAVGYFVCGLLGAVGYLVCHLFCVVGYFVCCLFVVMGYLVCDVGCLLYGLFGAVLYTVYMACRSKLFSDVFIVYYTTLHYAKCSEVRFNSEVEN